METPKRKRKVDSNTRRISPNPKSKMKKVKCCPSLFVSSRKPETLNVKKLQRALIHLKKSCPVMANLLDGAEPDFETQVAQKLSLRSNENPFNSLCRSLISQQLSGKAADSIYTKFIRRCGGESNVPTPKQVLKLTTKDLRDCGFSQRKSEYVQSLASFYEENKLSQNKFEKMTDNEIRECLLQVRGIGEWTIHMFLIFSLKRGDVLPVSPQ